MSATIATKIIPENQVRIAAGAMVVAGAIFIGSGINYLRSSEMDQEKLIMNKNLMKGIGVFQILGGGFLAYIGANYFLSTGQPAK